MESGFEMSELRSYEEAASAILALVKEEKVHLGRLELDLNRLAAILKNANLSKINEYDFESMKSVVTHFLETLKNE
jgi:hypothetical protein